MKLPFKWMRKRVSTALSDINKKFKKTVLCLVEKILSLFKHFKNLILNIFKAIKNGFLRFLKFILRNFSIIIYLSLSALFFALLIILVVHDRMGEVDTALKYVLLPLYIFSALFSGRIASKKIEHKIMVILHREPESRWATKSEIINRSKISRNYWLFESKCRNNAEITYTQRLQIASYFP